MSQPPLRGRCTMCNGTGRVNCPWCQGMGTKVCTSCGGSGRKFVGPSKMNPSGYAQCTFCVGGRMACTCGGSGKVVCATCGGTGSRA